jgi:hypothetical protein
LDRLPLPNPREAAMQIDVRQSRQHALCSCKLIGRDAEIDVAVGTQGAVGIAARDAPTFDEHGLDALVVQ